MPPVRFAQSTLCPVRCCPAGQEAVVDFLFSGTQTAT